MVGPTAAELESIKELIQFDHEYLKPVLDVQNDSTISESLCSVDNSESTAPASMFMDVDNGSITQIGDMDVQQSFKTEDEDDMDLLLAMGTDSTAFQDFTDSDALTSDTTMTCDLKELMGLVGSKDCDALSLGGKSDFGSGSDSGISDAPRSPFSDEGGLGSPGLGDGLWEESFTDLFPALDL